MEVSPFAIDCSAATTSMLHFANTYAYASPHVQASRSFDSLLDGFPVVLPLLQSRELANLFEAIVLSHGFPLRKGTDRLTQQHLNLCNARGERIRDNSSPTPSLHCLNYIANVFKAAPIGTAVY